MGNAGYDWVAVDQEHGSISHVNYQIFSGPRIGNTLPLVRLAEGTAKECKQVLDAGSGGVIVPMIETAEQLEKVLSPVAGHRQGLGVLVIRGRIFW